MARTCPSCSAAGRTHTQEFDDYKHGCVEPDPEGKAYCCGGTVTTKLFKDHPLIHHSYGKCNKCGVEYHSRGYGTCVIYTGPREMAAKWLDEQWKDSPYQRPDHPHPYEKAESPA